MSKSEDVQTLFRRFGGNASTYQEVVSRDQVTQAESKWPILGLINPAANQEAPSVRRPDLALGTQHNMRQPGASPASALAQAASSADAVPSSPVAPDASAGMFAGLTPSRSAQSHAATKSDLQVQAAANADARSHSHDSQLASPAVGAAAVVDNGSTQGGLFNRFKAVILPVAVKRSPAAEPVAPVVSAGSDGGSASAAVAAGETAFTLPSPPISTDSHVGGGMFASLVPEPSPDLSGALGRAPIRGSHPPRMESREPKVVPGSELQALFGRMLPPPPAPVTKKQPKSSKKAVKW